MVDEDKKVRPRARPGHTEEMEESTNRSQGYKNLRIWQQAHPLGLRVHTMSLRLPPFEMFEEGSQVRRSSKRISAGIVEGYRQRRYRDEFIRYLYRSLGSSDETVEHLEYLHESGSAPDRSEIIELIGAYEALSSQIAAFIKGVERLHVARPFYSSSSSSTIDLPPSTI